MITNRLDEAWAEINALGGYVAPDDERGQGYSQALNDALAILERFGARDPLLMPKDEEWGKIITEIDEMP